MLLHPAYSKRTDTTLVPLTVTAYPGLALVVTDPGGQREQCRRSRGVARL